MIEKKHDLIHATVDKIAISAEDAQDLVNGYFKQLPFSRTDPKARKIVAKKIIKRYSKLAAASGGATSLAGVVPGIGTVVSMVGGGLTDVAVTMKFQVDMTMCLAVTYGYDLTNEDARHLSFLIAGVGALEQMATTSGQEFLSKSTIKMTNIYLKGATLKATKEVFAKIGVTFTKKALQKAIPFGIGVLIGSSANYALSNYVGNKALEWFVVNPESN